MTNPITEDELMEWDDVATGIVADKGFADEFRTGERIEELCGAVKLLTAEVRRLREENARLQRDLQGGWQDGL